MNAGSPGIHVDADVAVVGAGPSGLTVANLLADRGWTVALVERHPTLFGLPRAGHIDHEAFRILQAINCLHPVLERSLPKKRNVWLDRNGEVLLEFKHWAETASGFFSGSMYQPDLEEALMSGLRSKQDRIRLFQGFTVDGLSQEDEGVAVEASGTDKPGSQLHLRCRYLVAADGAGSAVRGLLGIERDEFAVAERWMVVDARYDGRRDFGPTAVVGDPRRPHFFGALGRNHHRFEWKLFDHEETNAYLVPERAWSLLERDKVLPGDVEIVRQAVFTFEYNMARQWLSGRVALVGDAAHTMPPTMGQGLCSGMRDGVNIAWKLDLVLRGVCSPDLLDTYQSERYPHVKGWADLSKEAGEIAFITDIEKADERDRRFRAGERPHMGGTPLLGEGAFDAVSAGRFEQVGRPFPQKPVLRAGQEMPFDDAAGTGFCLFVEGEIADGLSTAARDVLESLQVRVLKLSKDGSADSVADVDGYYADIFRKSGASFFLLRPDRYVMAAGTNPADRERILADASTILRLRPVGQAALAKAS